MARGNRGRPRCLPAPCRLAARDHRNRTIVMRANGQSDRRACAAEKAIAAYSDRTASGALCQAAISFQLSFEGR
jgi:hypothetical protein